MKQNINKYLSRNPVKISEHTWFYHEPKGMTLVHEIFDRNSQHKETIQINIPWKKIKSAIGEYDTAKIKQSTNL